ncbi:hypothetical protein [Pollutibacter soli]|uniref:hypothetical protein n=1 Tax=Pollutibacter soli TaxID=3034157 RepID=UPI003013C6BB
MLQLPGFLKVSLLLPLIFFPAPDFTPFSNPPTGSDVKMFSPESVSDQFGNRDMAISPMGDEMFWTLQQGAQISVILYSKKEKGKWSDPVTAWFSGRWMDLEPAFSPDGKELYFASKRPVNESDTKKDVDLWVMKKENGVWSKPEHLPAPVNTEENEYYASVNRAGDIFFTRDIGAAKEDIVVCRKSGNGYSAAVSLPEEINSNGYEFNAFVDPDEKYILFTAYGRKDDIGGGDLYFSEKNASGNWMQAFHLGPKINSAGIDYCPFVSPDKKYFFFTSNRSTLKQPFSDRRSLDQIHHQLSKNGNGSDDIYWISFSALINQ